MERNGHKPAVFPQSNSNGMVGQSQKDSCGLSPTHGNGTGVSIGATLTHYAGNPASRESPTKGQLIRSLPT